MSNLMLAPLGVLAPGARWVVAVTLGTQDPVPSASLDSMADLADELGITVSARAREPGVVFTTEVDGDQVGTIPAGAFAIAEQGGGYRMPTSAWLADLRLCAPAVYQADALRPDTAELLATTDVAELLGVSRQRVHQLHREHPGFPAPYIRLGSGPIWTCTAIEHFAENWDRKPGRRPTSAAG